MTDAIIQQVTPSGTALSAEHYQTFETAKANDGIIGGDNIAQIRSYAAYARAQAQAIHKTIAATSGIDDVAAIKAEATETAQTFAKVGIYADQRIGEILRELPKRKGNQYQQSATVGTPTKAEAEKQAGIGHATAIDLQKLAANPEVVQAVLDKAEAEGRIPSRKQVLDAIKERDDARETVSMVQRVSNTLKRERDEAREDIEQYQQDVETLQAEVRALEQQNDKLYAQKNPKPQIVERTVEVVPEDVQRRLKSLEYDKQRADNDNTILRKQLEKAKNELDRAKGILNMGESSREVQSDAEYLIAATNQYVRRYGGLTWTVERLSEIDETTLAELKSAVRNLATFSNALMNSLEDM